MSDIRQQTAIEQEKLDYLVVMGMAHVFKEELRSLWHWGDGEGGAILLAIAEALDLPHGTRR